MITRHACIVHGRWVGGHDLPHRPGADGRQVPVRHPDFIMPAPSGRTIIVCQPDDSFNIIDLLQVTDLDVPAASAAPG
ncbi:MAG: hypothetical protein ACLQVF_29015 [Isosphaeraceae bacterium]